ncbi:MAG TPA: alpha/beta hydrolase [Phycisphaerae bacterium]|nr:alpha/beta hydrolase [Phycisphaerae bacterium]
MVPITLRFNASFFAISSPLFVPGDPPHDKGSPPSEPARRNGLSIQDVLKIPVSKPGERISYGKDPLQFGELRLPDGKGPHPVVVLIHGGCWLAEYDVKYFEPMADTLTTAGLATWTIEYRRVGNDGGGWPGTFMDVGTATDHLRKLAKRHNLDMSRVVVAGHSAGGHLALWVASRHLLRLDSDLYTANPLPILAVVDLGGPVDLSEFTQGHQQPCDDAVNRLMGGVPKDQPDHYHDGCAIHSLPLGVRQICMAGSNDNIVPPRFLKSYVEASQKAGDDAKYVELKGANHFDMVAPISAVWPEVEGAILDASRLKKAGKSEP